MISSVEFYKIGKYRKIGEFEHNRFAHILTNKALAGEEPRRLLPVVLIVGEFTNGRDEVTHYHVRRVRSDASLVTSERPIILPTERVRIADGLSNEIVDRCIRLYCADGSPTKLGTHPPPFIHTL